MENASQISKSIKDQVFYSPLQEINKRTKSSINKLSNKEQLLENLMGSAEKHFDKPLTEQIEGVIDLDKNVTKDVFDIRDVIGK